MADQLARLNRLSIAVTGNGSAASGSDTDYKDRSTIGMAGENRCRLGIRHI